MQPTKRLKPARELKVANPNGGHLPEEGAEVPWDSYWRRRLADGDVVEVEEEKAPTTPKPKSSPGSRPAKPAGKDRE